MTKHAKASVHSTGQKIERLRRKAQKRLDAIEAVPEVVALRMKLAAINDKIAKLTAVCPHDNAVKTYDSSEYDKASSWVNWHCPDCGKRWTTDK